MSSAVLSTPPRMNTSPRTTPALPADVLAYLDDSDEERAAPSFFYQPEELASPEKGKPPAITPLITPDPTSATAREGRQFARVASVPARPSNSPTLDEGSRLSKSSSHSPESNFEPETPASSNYLPRRPLTTASRPTFPSKPQSRSEFPSVTPGLSARYQPTSLTSTKFLPPSRRTATSGGSTSTPESDSVLSSAKESSPELAASPPNNVLSPRISPPSSTSLSSSTFTRPRALAGRLGNILTAQSLKSRKAGPLAETSEEEQNAHDEELERDRERERRRASLERRLEREREERERTMKAEQEEAAAQERFSESNHQLHNQSPIIYEDQLMGRGGESSPTQRDYHHGSSLRARSASSSDFHQPPQRPVSVAVSEREYQRAMSSMDHYSSQQRVQKSSSRAPPSRPGTAMSNTHGSGDTVDNQSSSTASRTRISRQASEIVSRPAPQPLSRQGSAPPSSIASSSRSTQGLPSTSAVQPAVQRHRRTPTAPSPSSRSRGLNGIEGSQYDIQQKENMVGVTWSSSTASGMEHEAEDMRLREMTNREMERSTKEREKEEREKTIAQQRYAAATSLPPQVIQPPVQQQQPPPQPPPQQPQQSAFDPSMPARKPNPIIAVHRKQYQRLECIGRGGSSRVYKVVSPDNAIYAIKRVSLENADQQTIESYKNEIALLKRLEGNKRIIRLIEFDSTSSRKNLLMVMECGEVDLAKLLSEKQGEPVDYPWVTSYWHQMLQAVQIIHEEKIVHSDLKPANFVLVKGSLKLIDFGIAKAIPNDTTNIQRDQQIGTVNYMSPEAIQGTHAMTGARIMKLGRASDVWSLGCILYQMIYGQPPFYFLSVWQKMAAIPDLNHEIEFPAVSVPTILAPRDPQTQQPGPPQRLVELATPVPLDVIRTMKNCLLRDPKRRMLIPELMQEKWNLSVDPVSPSRPQTPSDLLRPDEAIIDDNMMLQLMTYTLHNANKDTSVSQLREMIKGLRPALQAARKHRS